MPNYETHLWLAQKIGLIIGVVVAFLTFIGGYFAQIQGVSLILISIILGAVSYYSTQIGGVMPDIDLSQPRETLHYASIPYRRLVKLLQLILVILAAFVVNYSGGIESITLGWALAMLAVTTAIIMIRTVPDILHLLMPAHRRATHSITYWFITGIVGIMLIRFLLLRAQIGSFLVLYLPLAVCIPIFLGAIIHISTDRADSYVKTNVPDSVRQGTRQLAPWVPKHKPIFVDIPQLIRIGVSKQTPWSIRFWITITFLYGLIPIDLINSFIPVIGWIDDMLIYMALRDKVYNYDTEFSFIETFVLTLKLSVVLIILAYFAFWGGLIYLAEYGLPIDISIELYNGNLHLL